MPARPLVVLLALAALVLPARARSAADIRYGVTDDAWLLDGPGTTTQRVAKLQTIGVRVVRFSLRWNEIAAEKPATPTDPDDPAYDWTADTTVLDALHAAKIDVVLQLVGTPAWANGGRGANWAPTSAATFAAFVTAAAHEYPWVRKWLIWNEPNQAIWLRPTSAAVYTIRLLNPAYTAIHDAIPGAEVGGGVTAPRGSSNGVSPVTWLKTMHAVNARLDAYAVNPYPLDPKSETPTSGGCTECSTITMATLGRLETLVAANFPSARIWLTEYGYQTDPPDPVLGVSLAKQARYLAEGAYVAYRAPRVDLLMQFLYRDEPNIARFQSGLVTVTNAVKPSYHAFELPLAELSRSGTHTYLWGQLRAPAAGQTATLERHTSAGWSEVATIRRGAGGFFRWNGTLARGSIVRLVAGTVTGADLTIT